MRTLDFAKVLKTYLSDGDRVLIDHIPIIVRKLHRLAAIILDLDGFRFYGCSLLLIYDGDKEVQSHYSRNVRLDSIKGSKGDPDEYAQHRHRPQRHSRRSDSARGGRRSRSVEVGRFSAAHEGKRVRGEVNIRVVDFAHTTTGRDFIPMKSGTEDGSKLGKGYETRWDEETGLQLARFPPKWKRKPDMGFVFGLRNIVDALQDIWHEAKGVDEEMDLWSGASYEWHEGEDGHQVKSVFERAFPDDVKMAELST